MLLPTLKRGCSGVLGSIFKVMLTCSLNLAISNCDTQAMAWRLSGSASAIRMGSGQSDDTVDADFANIVGCPNIQGVGVSVFS